MSGDLNSDGIPAGAAMTASTRNPTKGRMFLINLFFEKKLALMILQG